MEIWSIIVGPFVKGVGARPSLRSVQGRGAPRRSSPPAARRPVPAPDGLLPEAETLDQLVVAIGILFPEILEQPAPAPDHLQQAAAGVVVLGVRLEVLGQVRDARREQRDLDLRGPRVGVVGPVLFDDVRLGGLVSVTFTQPPNDSKRSLFSISGGEYHRSSRGWKSKVEGPSPSS